MSDLISRKKIYDYIKGKINPYGKPFEGTAYELGREIMRYISVMDSDDICEWKYTKEIMDNAEFKVGCNQNALKKGVVPNNFSYHDFKYCPYCGKKIKLVK